MEAASADEKSTSSGISPTEPALASQTPPSPKQETAFTTLNDSEPILSTTNVPPEPADQTQEQREEATETEVRDNDGGLNETTMSPDQILEAALQEASARTEAESSAEVDIDVEMTDIYAQGPELMGPSSMESPVATAQQDSNSNQSVDELSDSAEGDSDTYEPPEATPPATEVVLSVDSPPFSPAPPETISAAHTDHQRESYSPGSNDLDIVQFSKHPEAVPPPAPQADEVHQANPAFYYP